MSGTEKDFSLVIPIHNEQGTLENNLQSLIDKLDEIYIADRFEILLVSNGDTQEYIRDLKNKYSSKIVTVLHTDKRGIGSALRLGFSQAKGRILMFYAIDLPFGLDVITNAIDALQDPVKLVLCSKGHKDSIYESKLTRKMISWTSNLVFRILFCSTIRDTQGCFLIINDLYNSISNKLTSDGAFYQTQVVINTLDQNKIIKEIPVKYLEPRKDSKIKLKDGLLFITELLKEQFKKRETKVLLGIVFLALVIRVIFLEQLPLGTNVDEAAKGYNAYSLLQTGKTFRGLEWPFYFNDYSIAQPSHAVLYNYLVVPFVAIFGLNLLAVRLPAALLGTLSVIVVHYLTKELFREHPSKDTTAVKSMANIASLLIALAPWHILLSRTGIEPISYVFFFLLGWYFYLKTKTSPKFLLPSVICLALCMYSYQSALVTIPAFLFMYAFLDRHYWFKQKKAVTASVITFTLLMIPLATVLLGMPRIWGHYEYEKTTGVLSILKNFVGQLIYLPTLYPFTYVAAAIAGVLLLYKKTSHATLFPMLLVLIVGLVPASLTNINGMTHYSRTAPIIGVVEILAAYSLYQLYHSKHRKLILWGIGEILITSLTVFTFYTNYSGIGYTHGYRELAEYIKDNHYQYENIYILSRANQPFIYIAFYLKYPPHKFLEGPLDIYPSSSNKHAYDSFARFGKFYFCQTNTCAPLEGKTLYILDSRYKNKYSYQTQDTIKYLGQDLFWVTDKISGK